MAGFIYIMSNAAFRDGLIKVGKSDRDPNEHRKYELETTGVPQNFTVEYYAFVDDHHRIERLLHGKLDHKRPNKQREFFHASVEEVVLAIRELTPVKYEYIGDSVSKSYSAPKNVPLNGSGKISAFCKHCSSTYEHLYEECHNHVRCLLCCTKYSPFDANKFLSGDYSVSGQDIRPTGMSHECYLELTAPAPRFRWWK
jgi:T5orf172 domain